MAWHFQLVLSMQGWPETRLIQLAAALFLPPALQEAATTMDDGRRRMQDVYGGDEQSHAPAYTCLMKIVISSKLSPSSMPKSKSSGQSITRFLQAWNVVVCTLQTLTHAHVPMVRNACYHLV